MSQPFLLARLQGAIVKSPLPHLRQRRDRKIQPEFKVSADERKTPLGEKSFSRPAVLPDIDVDGPYAQRSGTRDGLVDKRCGYPFSAILGMDQPSENGPTDV